MRNNRKRRGNVSDSGSSGEDFQEETPDELKRREELKR